MVTLSATDAVGRQVLNVTAHGLSGNSLLIKDNATALELHGAEALGIRRHLSLFFRTPKFRLQRRI